MSEKNDSFVFYLSFHEAIKNLDDTAYGKICRVINEYAFNSKLPITDDVLIQTVFTLIKPQIDANIRKRENGKKGGAPKGNNNASKTTKNNQKQPQVETDTTMGTTNVNVNVNDNINDNVTVNENNNDNEKENAKKVILDLFQDLFINTFNQKPKYETKDFTNIYSKISQHDLSDLEYVILESFNNTFYHSLDTCTPSKMLSKKNIESCLSRKQQDEEIKALYPPEQIICQECGGKVGEDKVCHSCKIRVSDYGDFVGYYEQ